MPHLSNAPVADRRPSIRSHHGDDFADPYEWLRDKENPDVIGYLEAENSWTAQQTSHLDSLTEEIFTDIKSRTKETDLSVPIFTTHGANSAADQNGDRRAWWYYTRTVEGFEYPIHCRVGATGPGTPPDPEHLIEGEQVLLDGNAEAEGHEFFSIGAFSVSPDGSKLAYSTDLTGAERYTVRVLDLDTGRLLGDVIENTSTGAAWAGNEHLFYARADEAWRPYQVLRHTLGTEAAADPVVMEEPDERFWVSVDSSRDERWIVIGAGSKRTSEYSLIPAGSPTDAPRVIAGRREGLEYEVEVAGDRLLILHNANSKDFELAEAPLDATSPEQWRTVIPAAAGVRLLGAAAYSRHAVVSLRRDGLTGLQVLPRDSSGNFGTGSDLVFDEPLYTVDTAASPEFDTDRIRVVFTSLVTPASVFDYRLDTGESTLLKRTVIQDHPVHGRYRSENYVQRREWAVATDGTRVPISLVHHKDLPLDGSAPGLIYGYGSYEICTDPAFQIARLSLLDRGFVYAIAHVRGGGELGRSWYDQGKTLTKKNTFTDFVACAEQLIAAGYTSADRLAARGGSAGGLVMGAVANLAPQMFRAIHAAVPFVDALTTILDPDLPLTVTEWEEWGDPLHDPEVYAYLKSYTPYENLQPVSYPAILATTSLNDTRVFYTEPAKWVAALRHTARNDTRRPILLKTEMVAGHGGVSGRYQSWKELAFEYAWLIDQVS